MADFRDFASNATQSTGTESGQSPIVDPGTAEVADGFRSDDPARARWLNWVLKKAIDAIVTLETAAAALQGVGRTYMLEFSYTADGTPANSTDVALAYSGLPAGTWSVIDATLQTVSGNAASATAQIRTAAGGGGSAVTTTMSAANANKVRDAQSAPTTGVTSATTHHMRRTGGVAPSGTVGTIRVFFVRTA